MHFKDIILSHLVDYLKEKALRISHLEWDQYAIEQDLVQEGFSILKYVYRCNIWNFHGKYCSEGK